MRYHNLGYLAHLSNSFNCVPSMYQAHFWALKSVWPLHLKTKQRQQSIKYLKKPVMIDYKLGNNYQNLNTNVFIKVF